MTRIIKSPILAIIGLGNPGSQYAKTRHNIGFRIVDALAQSHNAPWRKQENMEITTIPGNEKEIILIKPLTFMNESGKVLPFLTKKGIKPENIIVVHDELELPFGSIKYKEGGSAKGHNGLKSIIATVGSEFKRLRFGIGRPDDPKEVPDYVLHHFKEAADQVEHYIDQAATTLSSLL